MRKIDPSLLLRSNSCWVILFYTIAECHRSANPYIYGITKCQRLCKCGTTAVTLLTSVSTTATVCVCARSVHRYHPSTICMHGGLVPALLYGSVIVCTRSIYFTTTTDNLQQNILIYYWYIQIGTLVIVWQHNDSIMQA